MRLFVINRKMIFFYAVFFFSKISVRNGYRKPSQFGDLPLFHPLPDVAAISPSVPSIRLFH